MLRYRSGRGPQRERPGSEQLLGEERIPRALLRMSLPATFAMFINALYHLVDAIFIGRAVGAHALGGLGIAFPFQLIVVAISITLGVGSASVISRALGRGDRDKAIRTVGNAISLSFLSGIAFMAISYAALDFILVLFGATAEIAAYAREYLLIVVGGTPFIGMAICLSHVVRAEGDARASMVFMVAGAVVNIILDPILILGFDMGVRGAGFATVSGKILSCAMALWYYRYGGSRLRPALRHLLPAWSVVRETVPVGIPAFVRQSGLSLLTILVNNALALHGGSLSVAAFGVINRVLIFSLMPVFGIIQGFQPIAGFNYGAGRYGRVREVIRSAIIATTTVASVCAAVVLIAPAGVFGLFTTDSELIAIGGPAIRTVFVMLPLVGYQAVGATLFLAIGKAGPALWLSLLRQVILLVPLVLVLPQYLGVWGVWIAFPVSDFAATVITRIRLRGEYRRLEQAPQLI